jgi:hypothetical protein
MSKRGKTLVKGHTLVREGWPHDEDGSEKTYRFHTGCGKCSCGKIYPFTFGAAARKRWHAAHKAKVLSKEVTNAE